MEHLRFDENETGEVWSPARLSSGSPRECSSLLTARLRFQCANVTTEHIDHKDVVSIKWIVQGEVETEAGGSSECASQYFDHNFECLSRTGDHTHMTFC